MLIKKMLASLGVAFVLLLTGCGGGGGSGDGDFEFPTLKIGDKVIFSSSLSRERPIEIKVQKDVVTVKVNGSATISLTGGEDKNLFELKDVSGGKILTFQIAPNPYTPQDADNDGVYEVDITVTAGGESIIYKAAYRISIPTSAKDILLGNTFYFDGGDNNYSKIIFDETTFSTTLYAYDDDTALMQEEGQYDTDVRYKDNYFIYGDEGSEIVCTLTDENEKQFRCRIGSTSVDITFLESAPSFVAPSNYTVTALPSDIHNNTDPFAPRIESFALTGNKESENGEVQIYSNRLNGSFSIAVEMKNRYYAKKIITYLTDGDRMLEHTLESLPSDSYSYPCKFDGMNEDGNINYTCEGVRIKNNEGEAETYVGVTVCDDSNLSNPDIKCSSASIPVFFVEE